MQLVGETFLFAQSTHLSVRSSGQKGQCSGTVNYKKGSIYHLSLSCSLRQN